SETAAGLYRRARIGLNLHRSSKRYGRGAERVAHAESANPRTYELAACGLFQVSDVRLEIYELFGDAVPMVDMSNLERTVRAYLQDSPARHHAARQARLPGGPPTLPP